MYLSHHSRCDNAQVRSFKYPKREKMDALKAEWIKECGAVPVGNIAGSEWASTSKDVQVGAELLRSAPAVGCRLVHNPKELKMAASQCLANAALS